MGGDFGVAKGRVFLREHGDERWSEIVQVDGVDQGGLGGQKIRGSLARCRLGVRLCDLEKDLHELFLRRVRGLEFAREAMEKVEGRPRALLKKERDRWVRVTRSGGRNAFISSRGMGMDDRQPVITLQEDLRILSTEVM